MPRVILVAYALCVAIISHFVYKGLPEETAIRLLNGWGFISVLGMLMCIYDVIKEKK